MPIYEYRCESCGEVFEDMVLSGHSEPDTCPKCGAHQVSRLISNTNFQLKGGGWYVTDYGKGGSDVAPASSASSTSSSSESSPGESASGKSSTSTDAGTGSSAGSDSSGSGAA